MDETAEKMKVLLVDDEEELVVTLAERLIIRGISAKAVTSGMEAIKLLNEEEFDVVIVDVKMPGIGGIEVLTQIKVIRPQTKVILLTGRASEKERELSLIEGAFAYLIKPVALKELIRQMKNALGGAEG